MTSGQGGYQPQDGYSQGGFQPPSAPVSYSSAPSYSTTSYPTSPTNPAYSGYSTTVSTGPPIYSNGPVVTTGVSSQTSYSTQSSTSQTSNTPSTFSVDEKKAILDQKFANLIKMFELPPQTADQLQILANCKIVMLCDDSSSMGSPIAEEGTDPFALKTSTRWGELKKLAAACINIVTCINPQGT